MLLCGLTHLFFPDETEKRMSCSRNVRMVGVILLALILPAVVWGFQILAVSLAIFGFPRCVLTLGNPPRPAPFLVTNFKEAQARFLPNMRRITCVSDES